MCENQLDKAPGDALPRRDPDRGALASRHDSRAGDPLANDSRPSDVAVYPQLSHFSNDGFDRGAGAIKEAAWLLSRAVLFRPSLLRAYRMKASALRIFGAKVGVGVVVKPGVKIAFPWKLALGNHVWLGEDAFLLNLAPIEIGSNVCISQRAFLCAGNHDWSDVSFRLIVKPIVVEDGAWICANVFVAPGVTVGANAVITAGSVVVEDVPPGMVCSGNPCVPVKERKMRRPPEEG